MAPANSTDARGTANGTDRDAGTQPQTRRQKRDEQPRGGGPPSREGRRPSAHHGGRGTAARGRATGTVAICAVLGLLGVTALLAGLTLGRAALTAVAYGAAGTGLLIAAAGLVLAGLGLAEFVAAAGLWTGRDWGPTAGLAAAGVGAAASLVMLLVGSATTGVVGLALHGGVAASLYARQGSAAGSRAGR